MKIATWIPQDMRDALQRLDPAKVRPALPPEETADLRRRVLSTSSLATPLAPARRVGILGRRGALFASMAAVLIVAAGVALVVSYSGDSNQLSGTSTAASSTAIELQPAELWARFPASATPRPLVLIGKSILSPATGFPNNAAKVAFTHGQFDLSTVLPSNPPVAGGYPVAPATEAVAALRNSGSGQSANKDVPLIITRVTLTSYEFETDRGRHLLPAWKVQLRGVAAPTYVLAVSKNAQYNPRSDALSLPATVTAHGKNVTIPFVAHQPVEACSAQVDRTLTVAETSTAVVLAVHVEYGAKKQMPENVVCPAVGTSVPRDSTPGQPDTKTITLAAPLGNRAIVDATGAPYTVDVTD